MNDYALTYLLNTLQELSLGSSHNPSSASMVRFKTSQPPRVERIKLEPRQVTPWGTCHPGAMDPGSV